jgi:Ni/Fe-hydrogenase subunit HybB-like protein
VFVHGRFQSPILWDITVVTTYVLISLILYLLPLIPDMGILARSQTLPKWMQKLYTLLSFNWRGTPQQYELLHRGIRIMSILIIPVAMAIHTVTSWLFASTLRVGWDSTIFGPYFISGAFVAGTGCLAIAMYFFQRNYKLHHYITDAHFDKLGKLMVLVSLVYFYFNINEFLVPAYKMKLGDAIHLKALFTGHYAPMFWSVQILGLVLPIVLLLFGPMRKPRPLMLIGLLVVLGSWFKRYIIVVPTMEHPHLPVQNVPHHFMVYQPTLIEVSVTLASFILVLMIVSVLAKVFPVIPIWETAHEKGIHNPEQLINH